MKRLLKYTSSASLMFVFVSLFVLSAIPAIAKDTKSLESDKAKAVENLAKAKQRLNDVSEELEKVEAVLKQKNINYNSLTNEQKSLQDRLQSLQFEQSDINIEVANLEEVIQSTFSNLYEQKISMENLGEFSELSSSQSVDDLQLKATMLYTSNGQNSNLAQLNEIKGIIADLNKQGDYILGKQSDVAGDLSKAKKEKNSANQDYSNVKANFNDMFSAKALASNDLAQIEKELKQAQAESNKVAGIINSNKGSFTPPSNSSSNAGSSSKPSTPTTAKANPPSSSGSSSKPSSPPTTTPPVAPPSAGPSFIYPVNAYISDYYGMRFHPILQRNILHAGIDFGASYGVSIKATKSGKVIYASTMSGYGNVIVIDHGNGYTSLYAHMSSFAVSYGSTVSQGQTIGYVGSTGNSTGPHLHFEIRKDGVPVNPLNYL